MAYSKGDMPMKGMPTKKIPMKKMMAAKKKGKRK